VRIVNKNVVKLQK